MNSTLRSLQISMIGGVALTALLASASARAQSAPITPASDPATASTGAEAPDATSISAPAPQAAEPVADTANGDIVVTAQRRPESLTNVAASVKVVTSERLISGGVTTSLDLQQVTPGVSIDPRGAFAEPTIRGIGTQVTSVGSAANVAVYSDGIYQFAQRANVFYFDQVDSVQVLKGPQGTLYGRNATGGAILIQTRKPTFKSEGEFNLSYGNFDEFVGIGYLNTPLSENLAVNVTGSYRYAGGFNRDINLNTTPKRQDDYAIRGRMLWNPTESINLLLTADHSELRNGGNLLANIRDGNTAARKNNANILIATQPRTVAWSFLPVQNTATTGVTLEANVDFSGATLTSLTGYRSVVGDTRTDSDASPALLSEVSWTEKDYSFGQSLLLTSTGDGSLQYVIGADYNTEIGKYDPYRTQGVIRSIARVRNEALAGFVDVTYGFGDRLFVTGGVRYTNESTYYTGATGYNVPLAVDTHKNWDQFTPRATIRYKFDDGTNIYASYNKGFKSGGYNSSSLSPIPYDPETVDAYEIGIKARPFDFLSVELAAFHYDYSDIQFNASVNAGGESTSTIRIYNAAAARIQGLDLTAIARVSRSLRVDLGVAYTDGKYTDFENALVTTPVTDCGTGTAPCGNTQFVADATGNRTVRTPEWTVSISPNYSHEIEYGAIDASANLFYSSGFFGDAGNRLKQGGYTVLNASLGWTMPDRRVRVSVYGRNLTDEIYTNNMTDAPLYDTQKFAPPRTYGVALSYKF